MGELCVQLFTKRLPQIVDQALVYQALDRRAFEQHVDANEDQSFLRDMLASLGQRLCVYPGLCFR